MTGDRLRELANAATPGPWEVIPESDDGFVIGQYNERWPQPLQDPVGRFGQDDAELIALAPDLAVLLADAIDALEAGTETASHYMDTDGRGDLDGWIDAAGSLLARFRALGDT